MSTQPALPPVDESSLIALIARALVGSARVGRILADVCQAAARLCRADRAAIFLVDPEAAATVPGMSAYADGRVAEAEWKKFRELGPRPLSAMRLTNRVVTTRTAAFIEDARASDELEPFIVELFGTRSMLTVPIALEDRAFGTLSVETLGEVRPFGTHQLMLAQAVADQLALFVHKRILAERLQQRLRETEGLLSLAQQLGGSLDRAELARRAAREVTKLMGADTTIAFRLDPAEGTATALAGYQVPPGLRELGDQAYPIADAPVSEAVAKALESGEPIACGHTAADDGHRHPVLDLPQRPRAFVLIPLRARDRSTGAIVSYWWDRAHAVSEETVRTATAAAHQMSLALHNVELYEEATQALADLHRAQDELVRGERLRALGGLAGGTAHHLNNVLAVILGRVDLMLASLEDETLRRPLTIVERAARDGADVVRRVSEFAGIRPRLTRAVVDLREVVRDAVDMTRSQWASVSPAIEVVQALEPVPAVAGDAAALREVVTHLLANAAEALSGGGRIVVTTRVAGAWVELTVKDSGPGMTPEVRQHAFEPFFTTKGVRRRGLGLSSSYGIVSEHGGLITIDGDAAPGATVTIQLPAHIEPAAAPRAVMPGGPPLRILVVDGHPAVRNAVADALRDRGHAVVTATGGQTAFEHLSAGLAADLVVLSETLPDGTGWSVAAEVRERWPAARVGVIGSGSAHPVTPEQRRAVEFVLTAPIDWQALGDAVADVARRRAADGSSL